MPLPNQLWIREASTHDLQSVRDQEISLPNSTLFGDKDPTFETWLNEQNTRLSTPIKKPKGKELSAVEKSHNRTVNRLRQPVESLFNWLNEKTHIQTASKVR